MEKENLLCLEGEIWKDIPNYEGLYQASSYGRIRTCENKTTFTPKLGERHWKQRLLKGRGDNYKTGKRVALWKDGKFKDFLVARLVATTFLGEPTKTANTVNHINGNRMDNRVENLEWLSIGDNVRHAFETGLMPYKKVKLYNNNCELIFTSMAKASVYIGRNNRYISHCLKHGQKITSKSGEQFSFTFV